MASAKQITANRQNGLNGGPKTPQGKLAIRHNAVKHGLLSKDAVVIGDFGEEDSEEYNALFRDIWDEFQPQGWLEEALVERISLSQWRLKRVIRCETWRIRESMDDLQQTRSLTYTETLRNYYKAEKEIKGWMDFVGFLKKGGIQVGPQTLDQPYDVLCDFYHSLTQNHGISWQESFGTVIVNITAVHHWLMNHGWTEDKIRSEFLALAQEKLDAKITELGHIAGALQKERTNRLQTTKTRAKASALELSEDSELLMRYESHFERQFYRALHELERVQAKRHGLPVALPLAVDVSVQPSAS